MQTDLKTAGPTMRVSSMHGSGLTSEGIAAAFARYSRSPETVAENIADTLRADTARFHSKWTLDYGHSSIAEHAPVQLAVEDISRVACDILESGRLSSYTEKSSRFQSFQPHQFATPPELLNHPRLLDDYQTQCASLIEAATGTEEVLLRHLGKTDRGGQNHPRRARDAARALLPAAILTSAGVTLNARSLAHAVSKLLSHPLAEATELAKALVEATGAELPTLLRRTAPQAYLAPKPQRHRHGAYAGYRPPQVLNHNPGAERIICAALLYSEGMDLDEAEEAAQAMDPVAREEMLEQHATAAGRYGTLPREFELATCRVALTVDYGALRELNRHRMQTNLPRPLQTNMGFQVPTLAVEAGAESAFLRAHELTNELHRRMAEACGPWVAQYIVLHGHWQRHQFNANLRQLHTLLRLRTRENVHPSLRREMQQVHELCHRIHPSVFPKAFG